MNMPPSCDDWLPQLRKEFSALWDCRKAGDALQVQTPFTTATNKLVSVFILEKKGEYIVTDGGWLLDEDNMYGFEGYDEQDENVAIISFLADRYEIKQTRNPIGETIFYKKTSKRNLVASRVYDVASFISSCVTGLHLSFPLSPEVKPARLLFGVRASEYLKEIEPEMRFRQVLPGIRRFRYHAVKFERAYPHTVINYVTGSNRDVYSNDISGALLRSRLLQKASYARGVKTLVTLYDDQCLGYRERDFAQSLEVLSEISTHPPVSWSNRENIFDLL